MIVLLNMYFLLENDFFRLSVKVEPHGLQGKCFTLQGDQTRLNFFHHPEKRGATGFILQGNFYTTRGPDPLKLFSFTLEKWSQKPQITTTNLLTMFIEQELAYNVDLDEVIETFKTLRPAVERLDKFGLINIFCPPPCQAGLYPPLFFFSSVYHSTTSNGDFLQLFPVMRVINWCIINFFFLNLGMVRITLHSGEHLELKMEEDISLAPTFFYRFIPYIAGGFVILHDRQFEFCNEKEIMTFINR
ncbi:Uncharacterized protein FWK35_00023720 [Aphis craccivora]|uniref:Uncharacterized protein n=1 Tax=Aphis craccivora TaxID=307492 RepID=A0A6G0VRE5_APHCR|nr:Uncharacterized protein FWK35_00023720 [Aphis craccivora]